MRLSAQSSLAYHRAVADRMRANAQLIERARAQLERINQQNPRASVYVEQWRALLGGPLEVLLSQLTSSAENARVLRKVSPFAGFLSPQERWQIWRDVRSAYQARGSE